MKREGKLLGECDNLILKFSIVKLSVIREAFIKKKMTFVKICKICKIPAKMPENG